MLAVKDCIVAFLIGSVLLTAVLAAGNEPSYDKPVASASDENSDDIQGLVKDTEKLAISNSGGIYGLGSKILGSVKRGASSFYSRLPFIGGYGTQTSVPDVLSSPKREDKHADSHDQLDDSELDSESEPEEELDSDEEVMPDPQLEMTHTTEESDHQSEESDQQPEEPESDEDPDAKSTN